jgi:hypothetical protein
MASNLLASFSEKDLFVCLVTKEDHSRDAVTAENEDKEEEIVDLRIKTQRLECLYSHKQQGVCHNVQ